MFKVKIALLSVLLCLGGCCNRDLKTGNSHLHQSTNLQSAGSVDEQVESTTTQKAQAEGPSSVRSFEERWEDFKSRLKFTPPTDLVYFAEGLFDEAPREDRKRRMELAFFLLEVYQKRGDHQKAREYSKEYENLLQATMGGIDFRKHATEKNGGVWAGQKWKDESSEE